MTLPALAVAVFYERRTRPDRRRGRPRVEVDIEAIDVLLAHGWSHRRIARALRVGHTTVYRRTLERRVSDRYAAAVMYRCQECGALSLTSTCVNGHLISPGFLKHP